MPSAPSWAQGWCGPLRPRRSAAPCFACRAGRSLPRSSSSSPPALGSSTARPVRPPPPLARLWRPLRGGPRLPLLGQTVLLAGYALDVGAGCGFGCRGRLHPGHMPPCVSSPPLPAAPSLPPVSARRRPDHEQGHPAGPVWHGHRPGCARPVLFHLWCGTVAAARPGIVHFLPPRVWADPLPPSSPLQPGINKVE